MEKHSTTRGPATGRGGKKRRPQPERRPPQQQEIPTAPGLACPDCGSTDLLTYRTTLVEGGRRRERKCRACGRKFDTIERPSRQI